VREEAVCDFEPVVLEQRMRDYYDKTISNMDLFKKWPAFAMKKKRYQTTRVRDHLLSTTEYIPERLIEFLFRPFDPRWLYWEPMHKLLNEARQKLIPCFLTDKKYKFHRIKGQFSIVASQTP